MQRLAQIQFGLCLLVAVRDCEIDRPIEFGSVWRIGVKRQFDNVASVFQIQISIELGLNQFVLLTFALALQSGEDVLRLVIDLEKLLILKSVVLE